MIYDFLPTKKRWGINRLSRYPLPYDLQKSARRLYINILYATIKQSNHQTIF